MEENSSFNVAQLLKEPVGSMRTGPIVADLRRLTPELVQGAPEGEAALVGTARLINSHVGVLVQADLQGGVVLPCARCLEMVEAPLAFRVEETFVPTIDIMTGRPLEVEEDDRALWIDEHHTLDLEDVMRQDALLAAPAHLLCSPDCRGLCPTCGQNLNEGPCSCRPEADPRWSALLDMLDKSL
jgi:uncharacterized protein